MKNLAWAILAKILALPPVRRALIKYAQRTPYFHLEGYMNRWWVFNPHPARSNGVGRKYPNLPQARIHHILRADLARDKHNHPWDARTNILKGWYIEERDGCEYLRVAGDTVVITADTFHHISAVSDGGVWTLFITGPWQHGWGFQTETGFVPWREYPGTEES